VALGVALELRALPKSLNESHDKIAVLENKTEELRKENNILFKQLHRNALFDPDRFSDSIKGRPKMDVSILFAPNDEGSWWVAKKIEMGLGAANWRIVDFRTYREDDDAWHPIDEYGWKNMPLSMRLGASPGRISLGIAGQGTDFSALMADTNSPLGAVGAVINSFDPEIFAWPSQNPNPKLSTNVLQVIVGPGF
jgi:hypothetical protein